MPITSLSPSGSPQTATRAALVRLVIFERAVLFCPAQPADERSLPPAESSAEAIEVARQLAHGGYHLAIASQHPGVARGVLEMTSVNAQNRRLLRQLDEAGARIEAIAICPHGPDAGCAPGTGPAWRQWAGRLRAGRFGGSGGVRAVGRLGGRCRAARVRPGVTCRGRVGG